MSHRRFGRMKERNHRVLPREKERIVEKKEEKERRMLGNLDPG